jgi:hypothetical protein
MNPFSVKFIVNGRPVVQQNKDFNIISIATGTDTLAILRLSQL